MRIEHIGLWVSDLEKMRQFYTLYFGAKAGDLYHNKRTNFRSYFLSFEGESRLEIMTRPDVSDKTTTVQLGLAHLAIEVGNKSEVDHLTDRLRKDGFTVVGEPRVTGDGYYEAVIADPEGNLIEVTAIKQASY